MNKKIIKIISIVMCALLFLSTFSVAFTVFATTAEELYNKFQNGELTYGGEVDLGATTTTVPEQTTVKQDENVTGGQTEESTTATPEETTVTVTTGDDEKVTDKVTEENKKPSASDILLTIPENATVVTLDVNKDYGSIPVIFKNTSTKKEYEVILKYVENTGYIGSTMMPIGKYEISAGEKEEIRISFNEKTVEFRNYEESIDLTHRQIKNRTAPKFFDFLKNNALLIILFFGAIGVYLYITNKNKIDR